MPQPEQRQARYYTDRIKPAKLCPAYSDQYVSGMLVRLLLARFPTNA